MPKVLLSIPDDLHARFDSWRGDVSRTRAILRAMELAMGVGDAHQVAAVRAIAEMNPPADPFYAAKRKTVDDVLDARGGYVRGAASATAPPTREHLPGCKCGQCTAIYGTKGHP